MLATTTRSSSSSLEWPTCGSALGPTFDPPRELVDAITSGDSHYVAVLPRELAGDLGDLNVASLAGALIVEVSMPPHAQAAVACALRLLVALCTCMRRTLAWC